MAKSKSILGELILKYFEGFAEVCERDGMRQYEVYEEDEYEKKLNEDLKKWQDLEKRGWV